MAVRDFSILINLIKVSMEIPWPISLVDCRNEQESWFPTWTLPAPLPILLWGPALYLLPLCPYPSWITPSLPGSVFFLLSLPPYLCHNTYSLMAPSTCYSPLSHLTLDPLIWHIPYYLSLPTMNAFFISQYTLLSPTPWFCSGYSPSLECHILLSTSYPLFLKALDQGFGSLQCPLSISSWNPFLVSFFLTSSFSWTLIMVIALFYFVINLTLTGLPQFSTQHSELCVAQGERGRVLNGADLSFGFLPFISPGVR